MKHKAYTAYIELVPKLGNAFKSKSLEILIFDDDLTNKIHHQYEHSDKYRMQIYNSKYVYLFRHSKVLENLNMSKALKACNGEMIDWMKSLRNPEFFKDSAYVPLIHSWSNAKQKVVGVCIIYNTPNSSNKGTNMAKSKDNAKETRQE